MFLRVSVFYLATMVFSGALNGALRCDGNRAGGGDARRGLGVAAVIVTSVQVRRPVEVEDRAASPVRLG